jgi:hypothetical protein
VLLAVLVVAELVLLLALVAQVQVLLTQAAAAVVELHLTLLALQAVVPVSSWCVTLSCVSAWLPQAALLPHTPLAGSSSKPTHLHQAPISAWLSWAL